MNVSATGRGLWSVAARDLPCVPAAVPARHGSKQPAAERIVIPSEPAYSAVAVAAPAGRRHEEYRVKRRVVRPDGFEHGVSARLHVGEENFMVLKEGRSAPAFTLRDEHGREVALADHAGKDVIVYFYPKDDTPGCTKEACGFRNLWREFETRGAVVIGISPDDGVSHAQFRTKYGLPFVLLSDPEKEVMTAYGAFGEKMMYGRKTVGVIRSTVWIGPDGKIRKHWKRVAKAADHPVKVLQALDAAGS